jgi:hypothetical protein
MLKTEIKQISQYVANESDLNLVIADKGTINNAINITQTCGRKFSNSLMDAIGINVSTLNGNRECYLAIDKDLVGMENIILRKRIKKKKSDDIDGIDYRHFSLCALNVIRKRNGKIYSTKFNDKINNYKETLSKLNIDLESVAIVNGTVLEACGIRESGDLDAVISSEGRLSLRVDGSRIELKPNMELKPCDIYKYCDDYIINDEKNFFICRGLKFVVPQILLYKNLTMLRKKHNRHDVALLLTYMLKI